MTKTTQEKITLPRDYRDVVEVLRDLHNDGVKVDDVIAALKALKPGAAEDLASPSNALSSARLSKDAVLESISKSDRLIEIPYGRGPEGTGTTHIGGVEWNCGSWAHVMLTPDEKGRDMRVSAAEFREMHQKYGGVLDEMYSGRLSKTGADAVLIESRQQISGQAPVEALAISFTIPGFAGNARLIAEVPANIAERTQQLVREGELSVGEVLKAVAGSRFVRDMGLEDTKLHKNHGCAIYLNREGDVSINYPESLN